MQGSADVVTFDDVERRVEGGKVARDPRCRPVRVVTSNPLGEVGDRSADEVISR